MELGDFADALEGSPNDEADFLDWLAERLLSIDGCSNAGVRYQCARLANVAKSVREYRAGFSESESERNQLTAENQRYREALEDAAKSTNCNLFYGVHQRIQRALKGE